MYFPHTDRRLRWHILTTPKCCQRLADDNLRRETGYRCGHTAFRGGSPLPCRPPANCPDSLCLQRRRHNPAERVRGVRDQNRALLAVFHLKFNRIWIRKFVNLPGFFGMSGPSAAVPHLFPLPTFSCRLVSGWFCSHLPLLPPHVDRLQEGTHPDPQRSLYSLSSSFRISGDFPEFPHHTLDLIRQICVMPASKAYKLDIFQILALCRQNRGRQHPRVVIVYDIQTAVA